MKYYINILLFTILFTFNVAASELIDGPANIRDNPKGKTIITLNDNVNVNYIKLNNGWYRISIPCYIKKSDVINNKSLKKGSILFDKNNNQIGKVLIETNLDLILMDEINGKYESNILGYTYINNIRQDSIVEYALENIINNHDIEAIDNEIKIHIGKFNYINWFKNDKIKTSFYYENNEISPGPRVIIIFYNNKLVALIHTRKLDLSKYKSKPYIKSRGYQIIYFMNNGTIKKEIDDLIYNKMLNAD